MSADLSEEVEPTALANLQCIDWVRARITLPTFEVSMWKEDHQVVVSDFLATNGHTELKKLIGKDIEAADAGSTAARPRPGPPGDDQIGLRPGAVPVQPGQARGVLAEEQRTKGPDHTDTVATASQLAEVQAAAREAAVGVQ